MLIYLITLFDVCSGAATNIQQCVKQVANHARLTTPPCEDAAQAFCLATFIATIGAAADQGAMIATWSNPAEDYQVSADCYTNQDVAIEMCTNTCGFCCKLPKYDCNDVDPKLCEGFGSNLELCNQLSKIALEKCPFTCAMCDQKGAGGGCPDTIKKCSQAHCAVDELKKKMWKNVS